MLGDIDKMIQVCDTYIQVSQSQSHEKLVENEPLLSLGPYQELHIDFDIFKGERYLVVVDRYSGFLWYKWMKGLTETLPQRRLWK